MTTRDFDDLVAEALTDEEREFLASLEEPSMMQQGLDLFRGRNRAMNIYVAVMQIVILALGVFCLFRFLQSSELGSMMRWGAGLFYCIATMFGIKVWGWMEMQSNSIRREIKRVELQLASLSNRIDDAD